MNIKTFRQKCFLSHSAEIFPRESFTVALVSGSEKVYGQEGGGSIKIFRQKLLSHTAENLRKEYFIVALISCTEKVWRRGGGGVSGFSVKNFLSHSVENFRRGILYCCINFRWRKSLWTRGGRKYQDFPSENFSLTQPKISVGNPLLLD